MFQLLCTLDFQDIYIDGAIVLFMNWNIHRQFINSITSVPLKPYFWHCLLFVSSFNIALQSIIAFGNWVLPRGFPGTYLTHLFRITPSVLSLVCYLAWSSIIINWRNEFIWNYLVIDFKVIKWKDAHSERFKWVLPFRENGKYLLGTWESILKCSPLFET